ncbi:hypothetical protein HDU82_005240 [Entophlyctis luteolus]|nr:hypothetical protein HDU82_005240 [Entophlyctis luteolus]
MYVKDISVHGLPVLSVPESAVEAPARNANARPIPILKTSRSLARATCCYGAPRYLAEDSEDVHLRAPSVASPHHHVRFSEECLVYNLQNHQSTIALSDSESDEEDETYTGTSEISGVPSAFHAGRHTHCPNMNSNPSAFIYNTPIRIVPNPKFPPHAPDSRLRLIKALLNLLSLPKRIASSFVPSTSAMNDPAQSSSNSVDAAPEIFEVPPSLSSLESLSTLNEGAQDLSNSVAHFAVFSADNRAVARHDSLASIDTHSNQFIVSSQQATRQTENPKAANSLPNLTISSPPAPQPANILSPLTNNSSSSQSTAETLRMNYSSVSNLSKFDKNRAIVPSTCPLNASSEIHPPGSVMALRAAGAAGNRRRNEYIGIRDSRKTAAAKAVGSLLLQTASTAVRIFDAVTESAATTSGCITGDPQLLAKTRDSCIGGMKAVCGWMVGSNAAQCALKAARKSVPRMVDHTVSRLIGIERLAEPEFRIVSSFPGNEGFTGCKFEALSKFYIVHEIVDNALDNAEVAPEVKCETKIEPLESSDYVPEATLFDVLVNVWSSRITSCSTSQNQGTESDDSQCRLQSSSSEINTRMSPRRPTAFRNAPSFCFSSIAGLADAFYALGAAEGLLTYFRPEMFSAREGLKWLGCGYGSIVAAVMALQMGKSGLGHTREMLCRLAGKSKQMLCGVGSMSTILREELEKLIPNDVNTLKLSLFVSVTLPDGTNEIINLFTSKNDVVYESPVLLPGHMLAGVVPTFAASGAFSNPFPMYDELTVTISPVPGTANVSPWCGATTVQNRENGAAVFSKKPVGVSETVGRFGISLQKLAETYKNEVAEKHESVQEMLVGMRDFGLWVEAVYSSGNMTHTAFITS